MKIQIEELVDGQKIRWFNINLLIWSFLAMLADGYEVAVMSFAAPQMVKYWHVGPAALGPAFSASLVGVLVGAPLFGIVGDRYGRKTAMILSNAIYGITTLAVLFAANIDQVTLLRVITGIGLGGLMPNVVALNSELSPKRLRATLVVLAFMGISLGGSVPGILAVWLVPHFGWQVLFAVGGAVPLVIALCLWFTLPESVKYLATQPGRRRELLRILRWMRPDPAVTDNAEIVIAPAPPPSGLGLDRIFGPGLALISTLLWICFITNLMANYFLNNWMPLLFEADGLTPERAAIVSTLYHIGGTLGGLIVSVLLDRVGYIMVALMFAITGPALVVIGLPGLSYGTLTILSSVVGFCILGGQFGSNATAGLLYATSFRSKGVGWALAAGRIGSIAGPLVGAALVARHLPISQLFLAPAIPMVIGAICAVVLARLFYLRFQGFRIEKALSGEE